MKQNLFSTSESSEEERFLILSDGKPGHVNQSIAFARHLNIAYDLLEVNFKTRWLKGVSYFADRIGLLTTRFFNIDTHPQPRYSAVVSTGSETYYANRVLSSRLRCKSVAIMMPRGYRLAFDLVVAQRHDHPPQRDNLLCLPINLTYVDPLEIVSPTAGRQYVSIVVGGDTKQDNLNPLFLKRQIKQIRKRFQKHEFWLTTSRRTPASVTEMLEQFSWARAVYYDREPINPIPDFLNHSDYVFITADSSSMISEAVSFGSAAVEILPLADRGIGQRKFKQLIDDLSTMGCLHIFDGTCGEKRKKISLSEELRTTVQRIF